MTDETDITQNITSISQLMETSHQRIKILKTSLDSLAASYSSLYSRNLQSLRTSITRTNYSGGATTNLEDAINVVTSDDITDDALINTYLGDARQSFINNYPFDIEGLAKLDNHINKLCQVRAYANAFHTLDAISSGFGIDEIENTKGRDKYGKILSDISSLLKTANLDHTDIDSWVKDYQSYTAVRKIRSNLALADSLNNNDNETNQVNQRKLYSEALNLAPIARVNIDALIPSGYAINSLKN